MMIRILFCSPTPCEIGRIAASMARHYAPKDWKISYRSVGEETESYKIPTSLSEQYKLDEDVTPFLENEVKSIKFQVIISISPDTSSYKPQFSGMPVHIHWSIDEIETPHTISDISRLESLFNILHEHVESLFREKFLEAVSQSIITFRTLIQNLTDGVMAHDQKRRIFVFNKAAEMITGYRAEEVIGRDCHIVFPSRFCSGNCPYCNRNVPSDDRFRYPVSFIKKNGNVRDLEMSVSQLRTNEEKILGTIAVFRDVTEINSLRRKINHNNIYYGIVGNHPKMQKVFSSIEELSQVNIPILLQGESGTGKEIVARALHLAGPRQNKPFVPVNCGALPEGTLESELFGHVRGAFTGAIRDRKGRFELADKGTIFLDEIGEISHNMQVKLLRALQEQSFTPVGGEKEISVDVRIICATNRKLKEDMKRGKFREDLFYRLAVVPLDLPPLRDRSSDISLLVEHYLELFLNELGQSDIDVDMTAMKFLERYSWPGNVRELRNAVQYAIIKCNNGIIKPNDLPPEIRITNEREQNPNFRPGRPEKLSFELATEILGRFDNNKAKAARHLGVSRTTLYRTLQRHDLKE